MKYDTISNSNNVNNNSYFKIDNNELYKYIRKFNNYVKFQIINSILIIKNNINIKDNIIDLCSGKGQDLKKYIDCGFKNIYMFDNDIDGIIEIVNRKYKYQI